MESDGVLDKLWLDEGVVVIDTDRLPLELADVLRLLDEVRDTEALTLVVPLVETVCVEVGVVVAECLVVVTDGERLSVLV